MAQHELVVEGINDEHVIMHLCRTHGILVPDAVRITDGKGVDTILAGMVTRIKSIRRSDSLSFVLDADDDIPRRWQGVVARLQLAGCLDVPENPHPTGTIVRAPQGANIGIWLMPDNVLRGALEEFLELLIEPDDRLWPFAVTTLDGVVALDKRFPDHDRTKSLVRTWLAWQSDPEIRFGEAISKKFLDAHADTAKRFIDWLRRATGEG